MPLRSLRSKRSRRSGPSARDASTNRRRKNTKNAKVCCSRARSELTVTFVLAAKEREARAKQEAEQRKRQWEEDMARKEREFFKPTELDDLVDEEVSNFPSFCWSSPALGLPF